MLFVQRLVLLPAALVAAGFLTATPLDAQCGWGGRELTTMSRNLYFGASLDGVLTAPSFPEVMMAVDDVWAAVHATSFPDRAQRIADEIVMYRPDLIGLQEVALWRYQSPGDTFTPNPTPATQVRFDFLEILLGELAQRGAPYDAVVSLDLLDAELPNTTGDDIRLTDRDVILVRADLPRWVLRVVQTDAAHYQTLLQLPVGGMGGPTVTVYRGWVAADVKFRGTRLRFLNTHLEDAVPAIQEAQAYEFINGPAHHDARVLAVGDFNSDAITNSTMTYQMLLEADFTDVWSTVHPGVPGATWGQDPDLLNGTSMLTQRLDLILFKGRFRARDATIVGDDPADRTQTNPPLWPSDHAGIVATIDVQRSLWWWFWRFWTWWF